ncbi:Steroid 5-alpha reductase family enzyme [Actinopolyspora xinjiangensis]|uniref:Steroid 5-alpha reductase family enzyme n=1 Tax=Actinopolyspora xinjiangensis TaxID=405564 RepID=A0A1H0T663_9ACTN|nr:DUF1295 domain-containing protein [Actinopolyspora xinjiangensis]SDP49301.1 Steroid 5-alpha reductase family enzyme [Actinopolyspora xinjiangensis]
MNPGTVAGVVGLGSVVAWATVTVTFLVARRRGRYDTIDTAWGVGFALIAVCSLMLVRAGFAGAVPSGGPGWLATILTVVWGGRLALHLHLRNRGKPEDPRYREMAAKARRFPAGRMYFRVYLTQALVMWFVALPVQFAQFGGAGQHPASGVAVWVGICVWLLGFVFETVGDEQLRRFRSRPENVGEVLRTGLWRYTRHPNYFGDACVWWGLYAIACHQPAGAATLLSPVLMTWLLANGTGKPLLERDIARRRPDYAAYVRRTSGFLPLPPKRE